MNEELGYGNNQTNSISQAREKMRHALSPPTLFSVCVFSAAFPMLSHRVKGKSPSDDRMPVVNEKSHYWVWVGG